MYRFYETLPGILAWGTIALIVLFSWLFPIETAVFIILFDTYWLLKTIYLSLHLRITFNTMRKNLRINWLDKLQQGANREAQSVDDTRSAISGWQDVYHLIILPLYKEPYEVVKESLDSLRKVNYPQDKLIIVLSAEERAGEEPQKILEKIDAEFKDKFPKLITTTHPANRAGEIPGKSSNITWAAKIAIEFVIDPQKIPYEKVLVSPFDVDTQVLPEYFGNLTYHFLTCEYPQRSIFQPIPLFINNIYQAPALARVISFSSSFWHMIQQARPHRLTSFSTQAISLKPLAEVGFWRLDIVSEDSHIFWQCYNHFDGDWRVVPTNYPVSMDANVAPTFWQTMRNQYKQQQRWAWGGCENIPFILWSFGRNKKIPTSRKWYWGFNYIEGFHSWATNVIIIFTLGWLPILIGGPAFRLTLLSYSLPKITSYIMDAAMIGVVSSAILSMILLPPKPVWFKKWHYVLYIIQWILMPITLIIFGAFPALDAQTRGILGGKYKLGFWVTPKHRTSQSGNS